MGSYWQFQAQLTEMEKKYFLYMSKIKDITIHCNLEETTIECVLNNTN
jgi:hypothetical protein